MPEQLWNRSALELAAGIRDGSFSSRSVVEAHLARIEEVNGRINAIVRVLTDDAVAGADAADAAVKRGDALGAFHGVPFTIKDNIDVAGQPTTHGLPAFAGAIAPSDSPAVERMKAAGAVPIARTNLPDMGLRVHTDSSLYGRTKNPWNADRTAGGSSGGEGAALATGMSPIGLGNDIGGSLRNPAHACGIASIKPSAGVIPDARTYPGPNASLAFQLMAVQGVMARRVADVRAGFNVVAGWHPRDPISVPAKLTDLAPGEKLKVAVMAEPPGGSTHPEIAAAVRSAADVLSDAGHQVVEATPPDYEMSMLLWAITLVNDIRPIREQLDMIMGDDGRTMLDLLLAEFPPTTPLQDYLTHDHRDGVGRAWSLWFQEHPVLLSPTWTQPAFEQGFDISGRDGALATLELMRPVVHGNLLGLPCAVVPGGMADGLPVGVQVIGGRFTDLRVLAIAEQIESARPATTPIDPR